MAINFKGNAQCHALSLLIAGVTLSCAASSTTEYTTIPVSVLLDTHKGEQEEILSRYGLPDAAFRGPWSVTQWIYCDNPNNPIVMEFDFNGQILLIENRNNPILCASIKPIETLENQSQPDDTLYRKIDSEPQYRPHLLLRRSFTDPRQTMGIDKVQWPWDRRTDSRLYHSLKSKRLFIELSRNQGLAMSESGARKQVAS